MLLLPIETERLCLRPHTPEDREAFIELVTDERFHRHLTIPDSQRTPEGAAEVFDLVLGSYGTEEPVDGITIAERTTGLFVGTLALHQQPFGDALELFFAVSPDRAGEGLATEAVRALLDKLTDADVVALTSPENEASIRVALAAGMQDQGVRQHVGGPPRRCFVSPARP